MPTAGQILKALEKHLKNRMTGDGKELREWASKIVNPETFYVPAHQFEWGDGLILRAARMRVHGRVLNQLMQMPNSRHPTQPLTTEERLDKIEHMVDKGLLWSAKFPSKSTSQGSNIIHEYETQAWSELLEAIRDPWSLDGLW